MQSNLFLLSSPPKQFAHFVGCSQPTSIHLFVFFLMIRPPPRSPLFPYTPLFRSRLGQRPIVLEQTQQPMAAVRRAEQDRTFQPVLPHDQLLVNALRRVAMGDNLAGRCRSEEHTSELQSQSNLVCRLLLEKKKKET